jgi:hypothetical protein
MRFFIDVPITRLANNTAPDAAEANRLVRSSVTPRKAVAAA